MKTKTDKPEENNHSEENHKSPCTRICETLKDWLPVLIGVSFGITLLNIENINIFFNSHYTQVVTGYEDKTVRIKTESVSDDKAASYDLHTSVSADNAAAAQKKTIKKSQPVKPKPKPEPKSQHITLPPAPKPTPAIRQIATAAKRNWKLEATGTGNNLSITLYMGSNSLAGKNTFSRSDDARNHFTFRINNAPHGQVCEVSSNVEVKSITGGTINENKITFSGGDAKISVVRKY